jgi:hypothetical protein
MLGKPLFMGISLNSNLKIPPEIPPIFCDTPKATHKMYSLLQPCNSRDQYPPFETLHAKCAMG